MNLFDDDDYMNMTPQDNFISIIKTANQNIVANELEKVFARLAFAEKLLEENNLEEQYERELKNFEFVNPDEYNNRLTSIYLETVGNIVTQCE